jgi:hypothetical protein
LDHRLLGALALARSDVQSVITPFELFISMVVTLIGCGIITNCCILICDRFCRVEDSPGAVIAPSRGRDDTHSQSGIPDWLIVVIFSLGPIIELPLFWFFFVILSQGRNWN